MKSKNLSKILPILFGVLLFSSCTIEPVDVSDEITEANKVFMEAIAAGDAEAISLLYTEDAILYPPNSGITEGRAAVKESWAWMSESGMILVFETVSAEAFGNTAIEDGRYKVLVEGDIVVDEGKYIVIWKKVEGQWLLDKDIWNSNNPVPAPEEVMEEVIEEMMEE